VGPGTTPARLTLWRKPETRRVTDFQEYTGRTEAVETAEVRARVRGFLQKIHFREGADVKRGDLLYEIDPRTFQADQERAQAEVTRQQVQLRLAETEVSRVEQLRGTIGALKEEEYSQRVAAREAARAALSQAEATLRIAVLELSFTKIHAPIDGRIGRTLVTEGNLVGYNEPTLLTTIVRNDPVYVFFDVPENAFLEYQRLIREQGVATARDANIKINVALANESGFPHPGVLNYRDNRVDPGTGTVTIRGELPNRDRLLVPGLFARVRVPIGRPQEKLLIPETAVLTEQRGPYVLVVDSNDTVHHRSIKVGATHNGEVIVEEGLKADERIVVNGIQHARPGGKVQPETAPSAATSQTGQPESGTKLVDSPAPEQSTLPRGTNH
jgi:RND family efflux transporter MFP subunit